MVQVPPGFDVVVGGVAICGGSGGHEVVVAVQEVSRLADETADEV